ncbi:D-ribose ABC transporter substrate-binding protein [Halarsenatibacter silvermanii]|uniref:Ribose transport system substrate-binding protein n=1 Tax=Halarsenatibacter silvermanii TaxID=321763 RepID=A0A1G9S2H6_9FIRM|nr:D-ribose ABC transporter substrate-binding protein [Halarsenatibacter silvermanii]SDM29693.1 ribose transport system substrate-binding protein [Halarsenatibacter silvermanii]
MKKVVSLIVIMAFMMVAGFAGTAEAYDVGLAISTLENPFFVDLADGAEETAEELGVNLTVVDAGDDAATQMNSVEDLVIQGMDLVAINPVDGDAIVPAIEEADMMNIPVITVDRGAETDVTAHIASDNVEGGMMAAEYIADQLENEGRLIELEGVPGTSAARERGEGFNEVMDEIEGIEIIDSQPADFSRSEGMSVMEDLLEAHEDIDAVFAHNDEMALGAIEAIDAAGLTDEIMVVGFDAIDDALTAIEDGTLEATIAQQPEEMGRLTVEMAVQLLDGEEVDEFVPVPLELITQ